MKIIVCFSIILSILTTFYPEKTSSCSSASSLINPSGKTIETRFLVPDGFSRSRVKENSFEEYLRTLPLKKDGSEVLIYDGRIKSNKVHAAVVDLDVGSKDLQQCADACIRLRSEFLYKQKRFSDIHFNFTNGWRADYANWAKGNRIVVEGNKCYWKKSGQEDLSYPTFRKYLDKVFTYAGTLSLSTELEKVIPAQLNIGDVFIQGGSPGHAVLVVDIAENKKTGKKIFMLAQSYMPAQEIHVLKNLNQESISPWFTLEVEKALTTPEWIFSWGDLKRFKD